MCVPESCILNSMSSEKWTEHFNMLSRKAMHRLLHAVGLDLLDMRFHHSRVFDNVLFRGLGLDDGYYFITRR